MNLTDKKLWTIRASSGSPRFAIDDEYATMWIAEPSKKPWLEIDLGEIATLGGLEVYWGAAPRMCMDSSLRWRARCGRIFAARAMAKAGRTSSRSLQSRRVLCAGLSTIRSPTGGRRSSKSTFTRPPMPTSWWRRVGWPRSATLADQAPGGRERHGRFRLYAHPLGALIDWGESLWNRVLGASVRRRRELPRSGPHRDRRRGQRQLLVALHDQSLPSLDGA